MLEVASITGFKSSSARANRRQIIPVDTRISRGSHIPLLAFGFECTSGYNTCYKSPSRRTFLADQPKSFLDMSLLIVFFEDSVYVVRIGKVVNQKRTSSNFKQFCSPQGLIQPAYHSRASARCSSSIPSFSGTFVAL
jgi:hypothetical protein